MNPLSLSNPFNLLSFDDHDSDQQIQEGNSNPLQSKEVVKEAPATLEKKITHKALWVIENAHKDDIHGMISHGPNTFITGSKDGTLKMWQKDGELKKEVLGTDRIDYTKWVTALVSIDEDIWASGSRDGDLLVWDSEGVEKKRIMIKNPNLSIHSKKRNRYRINSLNLASSDQRGDLLFVGSPTMFSLIHLQSEKRYGYEIVNDNDWVYGVYPLKERSILVIRGAELDLYQQLTERYRWKRDSTLIKEQRELRSKQRPFISSLEFLSADRSLFVTTLFGGMVRLSSLEGTDHKLRDYNEHTGRVWTAKKMTDDVFATSADDGMIKLWDIRAKNSVHTIWAHQGRVSVLLPIEENILLSGACPDDVKRNKKKAEIVAWDIRRID